MWTNAVAKVSEFSNACHFDLVDKKGNFLIGLYQASFKALIIKSYERLEKGVYILYSNIVTGWEKKGGKVVQKELSLYIQWTDLSAMNKTEIFS